MALWKSLGLLAMITRVRSCVLSKQYFEGKREKTAYAQHPVLPALLNGHCKSFGRLGK